MHLLQGSRKQTEQNAHSATQRKFFSTRQIYKGAQVAEQISYSNKIYSA